MTTTDPTTRELMIELRAAVSQINALAARLDALTSTLASTYVPRGEYTAHREADDRRFGELEGDNKTQAGFRRQVTAGVLIGLVLLVADIITRVQGVAS